MYGMVKTTVYLPEDLKDAVERLARREGRSEAEVIREAVRTLVSGRRGGRPRIPLTSRGLGDATVAERVDEILEGFGQE